MASDTIAKKIAINLNFIALLSMTASGRLNADVAIINDITVPIGIPF